MERQPLWEMRGITKRFPGVIANENVDLTLYPGEVHALLGENGAGKSTLMNILTGIYFPNEGTIRYKGHLVSLDSPRKAVSLGIGMVHQHFKLVEPMTVAENICLYAGKCGFILNQKRMNAQVRAYAERFQLAVEPSASIQQLSIGEQQRVEILKLLVSGSELLILDEPTAVLTPQEADALFAALRKMAQEGKSVLLITHKLGEVMRAADRITVLRGGKSIATMPLAETTQEELTALMVGRRLETVVRAADSVPEERVVLKLEHVCAANDRNLPALREVDLDLHAGEIVGVAGVSGNGQRELAEVLAGMRKVTGGRVILEETDVTGQSPRQAMERGIAYIPEDRLGVGLVGQMDLTENYILKNFSKPQSSRHGILRQKAIDQQTKEAVEAYQIKNAGIHTPAGLMSGGNLQKLLVAREVAEDPKVIIAAYPVHGLDVGAINSIHEILLEERRKGKAILLISEDLEELFALSDRIAVLYSGRLFEPLPIEQATVDVIGRRMVGQEGGDGYEA